MVINRLRFLPLHQRCRCNSFHSRLRDILSFSLRRVKRDRKMSVWWGVVLQVVTFLYLGEFHVSLYSRPRVAISRKMSILAENIPERENDSFLDRSKYSGLGFFPSPFEILYSISKRLLPKAHDRLQRQFTIPYTKTLGEGEGKGLPPKWLKISGDLVVTGNGYFHTETLSTADLEELGGVEYRALRLLSYVVALVSDSSLAFCLVTMLRDYNEVLHFHSTLHIHRYCILVVEVIDVRFCLPESAQGSSKSLVRDIIITSCSEFHP